MDLGQPEGMDWREWLTHKDNPCGLVNGMALAGYRRMGWFDEPEPQYIAPCGHLTHRWLAECMDCSNKRREAIYGPAHQ